METPWMMGPTCGLPLTTAWLQWFCSVPIFQHLSTGGSIRKFMVLVLWLSATGTKDYTGNLSTNCKRSQAPIRSCHGCGAVSIEPSASLGPALVWLPPWFKLWSRHERAFWRHWGIATNGCHLLLLGDINNSINSVECNSNHLCYCNSLFLAVTLIPIRLDPIHDGLESAWKRRGSAMASTTQRLISIETRPLPASIQESNSATIPRSCAAWVVMVDG